MGPGSMRLGGMRPGRMESRSMRRGGMRPGRIAAFALACVLLAGCAGEAPEDEAPQTFGEPVVVEGGEYREIIVPELQAMLDAEEFPLINVHIPFAGNIPGTDESIPYDEIADNLDRLPDDRDATIVLYCRTGPMSERAATVLTGLGYTDVYHLDGGLMAWSSAGLSLEGEAAP